MKKQLIRLIILILIFLTIFIVQSRRSRKEYLSVTGMAQGTTYLITYENRRSGDLKHEIDSLLADFDLSLSTYVDSSVISRFNNTDSLILADDKLIAVFRKAYEVYIRQAVRVHEC